MKLVECVPNFSEGRNPAVINEIVQASKRTPGVTVLDCESDLSHNRMVLTLVGEPRAVLDGAMAACEVAVRSIDLTKHTGEHPRMGAVDVVPFVPVRDASLEECVALAKEFAGQFSAKFKVPVFLYEAAATRPERKDLAKVREGQFEGLRDLIGKDPSKDPDYGPRSIHPTAGATAVGARPILIAYNINLSSRDLSVAKKIARQVRGRDGGLATVKALGFELKERGMVQVSMNLTDYKKSSMFKVFELVSSLAKHNGVLVAGSELVGLAPNKALVDVAEFYLGLQNFRQDQIIENKLYELLAARVTDSFKDTSLEEFASRVASSEPVPGGGTVSAYVAALAASLVSMVCRLTIDKKGYESVRPRVEEILSVSVEASSKLEKLAADDSLAFEKVSQAMKMPKATEAEREKRQQALVEALRFASEVPAQTLRTSYQIMRLSSEMREIGNKSARSDVETAFHLAKASLLGAWSNVRINLEAMNSDENYVIKLTKELDPLVSEAKLAALT